MSFFDRFRRKKDQERLETLGRRDDKKTKEKARPAEQKQPVVTGAHAHILLHPVQSEKATKLLERNQYVFSVAPNATKKQVMRAVRDLYKVTPISVNVLNRQGKNIRYGRTTGRTSAARKAVVSLKDGETITMTQP